MAKRLLFINPAIRESGDAKHVPYGELLIAACCERDFGAETALFDINALRSIMGKHEIEKELVLAVQEEDWDVIGLGGITTTYNSVKRSLKLIRPLTDTLIILGGGILTAQPTEMMEWLPEVDVGVFGQATETIGDILKHSSDLDFRDVLGIVRRDQDGKTVMNRERPMIRDMDTLPLPKYDLAPLDIYFKNSAILLSEAAMGAKKRLDYASSIGCSLSCNFCFDLGLTGLKWTGKEMIFPRSHPTEVKRVNLWRSPEICVKDWKFMYEKYGCDFIALLDENLCTMNSVHPTHNWIEQISDLVIKEGLQPQCVQEGRPHSVETCKHGIHFGGTAHASLVTQSFLAAFKKMGGTYLDYGYESWDHKVLKWIKKGASLKTNIRSLIMTMSYGIRPVPNNQLGFEIDDFESVRRMMVAWEILGMVVTPFLTTPYPGADIYYRNKDKILETYGGDLELFVSTLNDATEPVMSISRNFTLEDLLVMRFHMVRDDREMIDRFENAWRKKHQLEPRSKEDQNKDWNDYAAEVQQYADQAHLDFPEKLAEVAYKPKTLVPQ